MAASMDEADAMVEAVERNGAFFNLGTNRRWHPGFDKMKEVIDSGELGALKTLIIYGNHSLFNGSSHQFDLILPLNSDHRALWASAHITDDDSIFDGDIVREDPNGQGIIQFENGVTVHALLSPRGSEWEAICERGTVACWNNGWQWHIRREGDVSGVAKLLSSQKHFLSLKTRAAQQISSQDLVHSLDTGEPSRCGVRVAHASTELIFAFMESHLQNGARVQLPLQGSKLRMERDRAPRQPRFQ